MESLTKIVDRMNRNDNFCQDKSIFWRLFFNLFYFSMERKNTLDAWINFWRF